MIKELAEEQKCPDKPTMKWVNDIFLNGKKIGGVLPRAQNKGSDVYLTIGIGVNINVVPEGMEAQATSLSQVF